MSEDQEKAPDVLANCKICLKVKVRNPAGTFSNGKDKRYVNEHGKMWNGKCCADCQADKMRSHMKAKRSKPIAE